MVKSRVSGDCKVPDPQKSYLSTLGLSAESKKDARKSALDRAHAIREFEIDLYWKRANYFWLLQAAVFAAVGLTWNIGDDRSPSILPIGLAALGTITATAGLLASQGSKFWQRNWEHHIDMLEGEFEGNLYKTVYVSRSGIKWSLTGISESLALCFLIFWSLTLCFLAFSVNSNSSLNPREISPSISIVEIQTGVCCVLAIVGVKFLLSQASELTGEITDYPDEMHAPHAKTGKPNFWKGKNSNPFLIRREPEIK